MAKKRHLTKAQILAALKDQKQNKTLAKGGPFTGIVTVMNYVLWKYKGWEGNKLIEFNERFHEYYNDDNPNRELLYNRLHDACDWGVEFVPFTESDMQKTGNAFYDSLMKKNMEYDNTINELSTMYLLFSFNTLLDMKVKPHKITEIKEQVVKILGPEQTDKTIMDMHNELYEELGIYIEVISPESRSQYLGSDVEVARTIE